MTAPTGNGPGGRGDGKASWSGGVLAFGSKDRQEVQSRMGWAGMGQDVCCCSADTPLSSSRPLLFR